MGVIQNQHQGGTLLFQVGIKTPKSLKTTGTGEQNPAQTVLVTGCKSSSHLAHQRTGQSWTGKITGVVISTKCSGV